MIRLAKESDSLAMRSVIATCGLFATGAEEDEVESVLDDSLSGALGSDHVWLTDEEGDGCAGVAYVAPERMTTGTWNLYLIAVNATHQGKGRGAAMVQFVERMLSARNERVLLVETSGLPRFEATRSFYRKCGFEEEARIREFYKAGDDKIIFRKALFEAITGATTSKETT